jgi:aryl-alcohol dehydrogenase-like predicted oxidoreductase
MQYRELGKDGPEIPAVGFGGWPIGGGMGAVGEEEAIRSVRGALEQGMSFIDTAQAYKSSQERIGKALEGIDRERYFLATKVSFDMSAEGVRKAMEESLRSLGVEYVDLYQVHWWDDSVPIEETLEAILKLQEEGKLRHIGVSNFTVKQMKRALKTAPFVSNQINYNIFLRTPEKELFPFCREQGIGILVHSTLAKGFLSGKFTRGHRFDPDDERSRFSQYQGREYLRYLDAVEELKSLAAEKGWTIIELAIAWALRIEEVSAALVGISEPQQLEEPARAGDLTLSEEDAARVDEVLGRFDLDPLSPFDWQIV